MRPYKCAKITCIKPFREKLRTKDFRRQKKGFSGEEKGKYWRKVREKEKVKERERKKRKKM